MCETASNFDMATPGLHSTPIPEEAQQQFHAELEGLLKGKQDELAQLRAAQRQVQGAQQQELSDIAAKLASFDGDLQSKQAELQKLQCAHCSLFHLPLSRRGSSRSSTASHMG